jgi:hypothetical protein
MSENQAGSPTHPLTPHPLWPPHPLTPQPLWPSSVIIPPQHEENNEEENNGYVVFKRNIYGSSCTPAPTLFYSRLLDRYLLFKTT